MIITDDKKKFIQALFKKLEKGTFNWYYHASYKGRIKYKVKEMTDEMMVFLSDDENLDEIKNILGGNSKFIEEISFKSYMPLRRSKNITKEIPEYEIARNIERQTMVINGLEHIRKNNAVALKKLRIFSTVSKFIKKSQMKYNKNKCDRFLDILFYGINDDNITNILEELIETNNRIMTTDCVYDVWMVVSYTVRPNRARQGVRAVEIGEI